MNGSATEQFSAIFLAGIAASSFANLNTNFIQLDHWWMLLAAQQGSSPKLSCSGTCAFRDPIRIRRRTCRLSGLLDKAIWADVGERELSKSLQIFSVNQTFQELAAAATSFRREH